MKQQVSPKSLKPGCVLFAYDAFTYDDGGSSVELQQWVVRNIRAKRYSGIFRGTVLNPKPLKFVNLICKLDGITWFKGQWKKYIPDYHKKGFRQGSLLPRGVYTTKLMALKYAVKRWEGEVGWYPGEIKDCNDDPEFKLELEREYTETQKELRLLKGQLTKLNNKRKKEKTNAINN